MRKTEIVYDLPAADYVKDVERSPGYTEDVPSIKSCYIPMLVELVKLGAKERLVYVTENDLSVRLGKSQQLVSRRLSEMESDELIPKKEMPREALRPSHGKGICIH